MPAAAERGVGVMVNLPLEKARLMRVVEGVALPGRGPVAQHDRAVEHVARVELQARPVGADLQAAAAARVGDPGGGPHEVRLTTPAAGDARCLAPPLLGLGRRDRPPVGKHPSALEARVLELLDAA